jgi:hypothetical protein
VEFAADADGESETRAVFDSLVRHEKASLHVAMQRLADFGRLQNDERFRTVTGSGLWEFRKNQHRFLGGFLPARRFVIAAYERKKKWKLRPETIQRALRIMNALRKTKEEQCLTVKA